MNQTQNQAKCLSKSLSLTRRNGCYLNSCCSDGRLSDFNNAKRHRRLTIVALFAVVVALDDVAVDLFEWILWNFVAAATVVFKVVVDGAGTVNCLWNVRFFPLFEKFGKFPIKRKFYSHSQLVAADWVLAVARDLS